MAVKIQPLDLNELYNRYIHTDNAQTNPYLFIKNKLGITLYDKQIEMLNAIWDYDRVAICGANATGKDFLMSQIVLTWLSTHYPAKVLITGPTSLQVTDIVWRETRNSYDNAKYPLGGNMMPVEALWVIDDTHYARGFATDKAFNLQGWHSPNLLVIITEAHAVPQDKIDAIKRLFPNKLILSGNPLVSSGEFYDAFIKENSTYHTIQLSAFDSPNVIAGKEIIPGLVTIENIEQAREDWGEDSPLYIVSILGQFPENLTNGLVSLLHAREAVQRTLEPSDSITLGVDVATSPTGDRAIIYCRAGMVARMIYSKQGASTMDLAGFIKGYVDDLKESSKGVDNIDSIVVDYVGVGTGVVDRLRELGVEHVVAFQGGSNAIDKNRYVDKNAECWWLMKLAFESGNIDIDENKPLISAIVNRTWKPQSDRRIQLQPKDEYKKENNSRSPDEADALAMTYSPTRQLFYG